jgi:hypothetical protein
MTKANKLKLYSCWWLHSTGKTDTEIAEELQLELSLVQEHIQNMPVNTKVTKPTAKDLMITQTSGKGTNSVAIMTKQASELGDELKKSYTPPKSSTGIFRPRS